MEALNPGTWSDLPRDLLVSIFQRLSFADFHRANIVCWNWNSSSKLTLARKSGSPWLILFPDGGSCALYNPDEDRIYPTERDWSGFRFLANSGSWFLVLDSRSDLHIIDLFSKKTINLPSLESKIQSGNCTVKRIRDRLFTRKRRVHSNGFTNVTYLNTDDLRGLLWIDEKTQEYVVVWFLEDPKNYVAFCKKGDDHYTYIPMRLGVSEELQSITDVVLRGYHLYIITSRSYVRFLDLSGPQGFQDVTWSDPFSRYFRYEHRTKTSVAVTTSGEVLLVTNISARLNGKRYCRGFRLYKNDGNLVKLDSLGDEALILDSGITVPTNNTFGFEPNSIYFTSYHFPLIRQTRPFFDICVFNLVTKTFKRFPRLSNMKLKDARWFFPYAYGS